MALLNQASVDSAIEEGLEHIRPIVAWRMMDHARGGILIVAGIDVRDDGRTSAGQVLYVTDYAAAVFAEPSHAIGRWRGESHLGDVPSARPLYGRIEYRYYWATRR
jgi:hypothetical protein